MMKQNFENRGSRTAWDEMTTQELEDLLAQDFAADQDGFLSPEDILAITEVINDREEDTPSQADAQAAWEAFRARIQEEANPEDASTKRKARKIPRRFLRCAVVAAVLAALLAVPVAADYSPHHLVRWTEQHFSFLSRGDLPQENPGGVTYAEVKETVEDLATQPVLPQWYPLGTTLEEMTVDELVDGTSISILFSLRGDTFTLFIDVFHGEQDGTALYEKSPGDVETYYVGHIPHYIMKNMDRQTAVWRNGNTENAIHGNLSTTELQTMIDSIYQ